MNDIFDNPILCKNCRKEMQKKRIEKDGFILRIVECPNCKMKIMHPANEMEYSRFNQLRNKTFRIKMRIVGNSYAVSIPREIVNFIKTQEKIMDDMVRMCFDDSRRLSLFFGDELEDIEENKKEEYH
jgi:hypothetical protein